MLQVQYMKPFYTKVLGDKIRLVFAYQYFSISKDGETYHFIPIEGKEIIINKNTRQVENLSEVLVFQNGNRFIRLPIYQLLLISNVQGFIDEILGNHSATKDLTTGKIENDIEVVRLLEGLNKLNIDQWFENAINKALDDRNEEKFYELIELKKQYQ